MIKTIAFLFVLCLFLMMIGCKTPQPQYIPVESVKFEYRDRFIKDSIHTRDSVIVTKNGDTLKIRETRYVYSVKTVHDSIHINDTIRVPVIVPKPAHVYK